MDELKDIVFFESEIVDDDDDAPIGTLVHIYDTPTTEQNHHVDEDYELVAEVVDDEVPTLDEVKDEEQSNLTNEVIDTPAVNEPIEEVSLIEESIKEVATSEPQIEETPIADTLAEPIEEKPAPKKASAKKKQEPADPWAVAPIVNKTSSKKEENKPVEDAPKKNAPTKKVAESKQDKPVEEKSATKKTSTKKTEPKVDDNTVEEKPAPKKTPVKKSTTPNDDTQAVEDSVAPAPKKAPAKKKTTTNEEPAKVENTKAEAKMSKEPVKKTATKPADDEKVLVPGDDSAPHGKFVVKHTEKDHYVYKLYSYNYRVVAIGAEQYASLPSCKGGIQSVIKNAATAPIEDLTLKNPVEQKCPKWVIYKDKKEEFRLRLIASNGNIVATTNDGYLSKDSAKKGIEAIARAAKGASIVRNDNLW